MKYTLFKSSFLRSALYTGSLILALSSGLSSCQKDDWFWKKHHHGGGGNGGGHKDTTINRDTVINPVDSTGRDTLTRDSCDYYRTTDIDDVDITNGQTFGPNDLAYIKVSATATNGCATEFVPHEGSRSVNGSTVDVYLDGWIHYVGCTCTAALVPVSNYIEIRREQPYRGTLKYQVHYTDASSGKEVVKYFYQ